MTPRESRRDGVFVAIAAVHAVIALLLLRAAPPPAPPPVAGAALTVVAVPVVVPTPVADIPLDAGLSPPVVEVAAAEAVAAPPCAVLDAIAAALAADPGALAALGQAAAATTPAVMAWDGAWTDAALPLRPVVAAVLGRVAPQCRDEALAGPRIVFVSVAETTVGVAFGSGAWRWRDLLPFDQHLPSVEK